MLEVVVVVAVRNEEKSLPAFVAQVEKLPLPDDVRLRLLFVEDSSRDETVDTLRRLATEKDFVDFVSLEKGFGQSAAIMFGVSIARGDAVVMMDGDGSHPVSAIPDMISQFRSGADVVQCVRASLERRSLVRRIGSVGFQKVASFLVGTDLARQNTYFRLISAQNARAIAAIPQVWRSARLHLPASTSLLTVQCSERAVGKSNYNLYRLLVFACDIILSLIDRRRLAALLSTMVTLTIGVTILLPILGYILVPACLAAISILLWRFRAIRRPSFPHQLRVKAASPRMSETIFATS